MNELQRAQAFRVDWEAKGWENWLKNQKIKKRRQNMEDKFQQNQTVRKQRNREKKKR